VEPGSSSGRHGEFHFYDLRHTGNTLAAGTGASTKELMARMGHASARASLIYQHASEERDVVIAERLSAMTEKAMRSSSSDVSGVPHLI
jgi:integrase